jgi:hypothetical protein
MVTRLPVLALRRRLLVAALGLVLAGGICAAVLVSRSPTQGPESAGQSGIIPHLVPDVGGLHSGSQGTSSAPHASVHTGTRLIPSAGGSVRVYGGAPTGATFSPARNKG